MTLPFRNQRTVGVKGAYRTRQTEPAARFAQAEAYRTLAVADHDKRGELEDASALDRF